ncbi:MAG: amidohydrolase [Actinomycetota bacterium]|nr:amidohydrolase [Actinomycetota bacterium]
MPSFDFHQHLWPEAFISELSRRSERPRLRGSMLELDEGDFETDLEAHRLEARLGLLDRDGIDAAVVSLQPTLGADDVPELVDAYHAGIQEVVSTSGGRIVALASGACLDGFAGASISARSLIDLDGTAPLLRELESRKQLLFVHPGPADAPRDLPDWWPAVVDYTAEMQAAWVLWLARGAAAYPGLPLVFAILAGGGPFQLERLRSRGVDVRTTLQANVFLDTASYGRRALELCLATYGVGRLVYGSDLPVVDSRPTLRSLREFGDAVTEAICRENPMQLLG